MQHHFKLKCANIMQAQESAILLPIDGAARGMEGNVARAFGRHFPDTWGEIEQDIAYPIALGDVQALPVPQDLDCHFKLVQIASTLNHIDVMNSDQKARISSDALYRSARMCASKGVSSLATPLLKGGWRLSEEEALEAMIRVWGKLMSTDLKAFSLGVYVLDQRSFFKLLASQDCAYEHSESHDLSVTLASK